MGVWIDVDGQRLQVLPDGGVLWEHDTRQPYDVTRHMVGPRHGATWRVLSVDPLSLTPSLHCDAALGGCGLHGHVIGGHWT